LQFQRKDTISTATVNIYARITSLSRRVVNVFEDVGRASTMSLSRADVPAHDVLADISRYVRGNVGTD